MSFRARTIIGIALIESVLLLLLVWYSLDFLYRSNVQAIATSGASTAKLLASSAKDAVLSTDLASLDAIVDEALKSPGVVYARVQNLQGILVEKGDRSALAREFAENPSLDLDDPDGVFDVSAPITEANQSFGTVQVGISLDGLRSLMRSARTQVTGIAALEIVLVALFSFVLGTYLSGQLQRLKQATERVARGEAGVQLESRGRDEIAQTVDAFNRMSMQLGEDRRRIDELLQEAGEVASELTAIMQGVVDGILIVTGDGLVRSLNPAAAVIFGVAPADAVSLHLGDLLPGIDTARLDGLAGRRFEASGHRADGTGFTAEVGVSQIEWRGQSAFALMLRDVSTRKSYELRMEQVAKEAESASRAKSRFIATMSHEIRTPLHAIQGALSQLEDDVQGETRAKLLHLATQASDTLQSLIGDVLDFSKIEAGMFSLQPAECDPVAVVEQVVAVLAPRAREKSVEIVTCFAAGMPRKVIVDPDRLRQMLMNLVGNAVKFTSRGDIAVRVEWWPGERGDLMLAFRVTDTGIGIPEESLDRLFGEFAQADDSTSRMYGGTGLGLAISKRLVELMGGHIGVESAPGLGSTFWFELPVRAVGSVTVEELFRGTSTFAAALPLKGLEVIVWHPHVLFARTLAEQIVALGGSAIAVDQEQQFFRHYAAGGEGAHSLMAMVSDQLPGVDFYTILKELSDAERARLVVMTTDQSPQDMRRLLEESGIGTLDRPIRLDHLIARLQGVSRGEVNVPLAKVPGRELSQEDLRDSFKGLRALLVDDSPANLIVGGQMLRKLGVVVDDAPGGLEALDLMQVNTYDIVFMDVMMPEVDGLETTRRIRASAVPGEPEPVIVALTADASLGTREQCRKAGMNDFLSKPFRPQQLAQIISRSMQRPIDLNTRTTSGAPMPNATIPVMSREGIERLAADTGGWEELPMMFEVFLTDLRERLRMLAEILESGDCSGVGDIAHVLKSTAATFGAAEVTDVAKRALAAARSGARAELEPLARELLAAMERALDAYENFDFSQQD